MASKKIPPETVQVFRSRPFGLRLGSRNGITYVYAIDKPKPSPPAPSPNPNPNPNSGTKTTTMAQIQYNKLLSLIGKRLLKVQEIDVQLHTLQQISHLINTEKLPIYITFAEDIGIFEDLEQHKFDPDLHLSYFRAMIETPPSQYAAMDVQRMTLLFFSVFGIDILCDLDLYYKSCESRKKERTDIINWIYAQQIVRSAETGVKCGGFRGGSFLGLPFENSAATVTNKWDRVNMASTHNALCMLVGLGDDLRRLDRVGIIATMRELQDPLTGAFCSMRDGEVDLRFVYCACVISHLLDDWSGVNVEKATEFICGCQAYDGSLGFGRHFEGHGGSTFVGVAALVLMDKLHRIEVDALLRWLLFNQGNGFKGRPEKPEDSCYSFWCGAVLSMLSSYKQICGGYEGKEEEKKREEVGDGNVMDMVDLEQFYHCGDKEFYNLCNHRFNRIFNLLCQSGFGGFAKLPHIPYGDILHGYMGLAGLSLMSHKIPKALQSYENYPNLFKKRIFPITSCSVSYHDIQN